MAHFFGRLFKKNTRKGSPSPAYFEALESRQLLSATYKPADLNGTWAILNDSSTAITGTITVVGGLVDGTSAVKVGGVSVVPTDLHFTVNGDGTVDLSSTTTGATFTLDLGRINSNKSVISLDDAATGDTTLLVKKDAAVTKDELKGTWSFATDGANGTITVGKNASGNLVITSAVFKENGQTVAIDKTNSSIAIGLDGSTITLTLKPVGHAAKTYTGVKAESTQGDVLAFQDASGVLSVAVKQDAATKFVTTDLAAGGATATWFATGSEGNGELTVTSPDSKGNSSVSGNLTVNGVTSPVSTTGKLKLNADGSITGTLTLNPNSWLASTITVTGRMNLSKNILELHSADGSFFVTLTTSADHAAIIANTGKTVSIDGATNVTGGQGKAFTYEQIITAMGLTDIDGDTQDTLTLVLKNGSLKVNGVTKNGTVTIGTGDTLVWYTDSTMGAGAKVIGFTVKVPTATDAAATSIRFVHVANPVTLTTQVATASATADAKVVVTRTNTSGEQAIIINLTSDGMTAGTDYSLALASTDTAKGKIEVDASGKFATVTLNDKVASVTILVKNKAITNTGSRIVTLSLASVLATTGYEVGATKNAVDVTVAGTHSASAGGISVTGPMSITEGAKGVFVIASTKAPAGDQIIDITVSGITGRYSLEYNSSNSTTGWTPATLTGDATTVKLLSGKTKVYVRMTLIDDSIPQGDKAASLAISLSTNTDKFYVNEATSIVDFTAKDNEQKVTVKASVPTVNEGKSATFTISVPTAVAANSDYTFTLGGTADLSQYTVSGATYNAGVYTATILKGARSVVVTIAAKIDTNRTEGDETVILTMNPGVYIVPESPTTITIKDVTTDVAPTLTVTSAKLPGDFVEGSATGTNVTVASLIAAAKATDLEDGTNLSIKITKIDTGVTLKVDGSAIAVGAIVATGKTIVVFISSSVTTNPSKALFSGVFKDSETGVTAKTFSATGNVPANAAPTIANATATLTAIDAGATDKTVTYQNLLDATNPTDANGDPIIFVITSIATGITLTKNAGKTAVAVKTEISSTDYLNLPILNAVSTGTELFTVKVKDASHTTLSTSQSVISIAVNNTAPSLTAGTIAAATTFSQANATGTDIGVSELVTALSATDASDAPSALTFKVTAIQANVTLKINGVSYTSVSPDLSLASISGTSKITVIVNGSVTIGTATNLFTVEAIDLNSAASSPVLVSGNVTA